MNPTRVGNALLAALPLALTGALLSGCTHGDAIIFASNKQIGLKVGMDTKEVPEVSIGYNGQDFAFVPLYKKGYKPKEVGQPEFDERAKYKATKKGDTREDAYSVFGSFTGSATGKATVTSGGTSGPEAKAELSLGHFFATGLAAQTLAEDSGAASVAKALEESKARVDAKIKKVEEDAAAKLEQVKRDAEAEKQTEVRNAKRKLLVNRLVAEVSAQNDSSGAPALAQRKATVQKALDLKDPGVLTDNLLRSSLQLAKLAEAAEYDEALKSYYQAD